MAEAVITAHELCHRLLRSGHFASGSEETTYSTDVCPSPETIVTVSMNLDPTLMPAYRERDSACKLKSREEPVPELQEDPSFALPAPLRELAIGGPSGDCFLGGPFRWLLRRIVRIELLLLWPAHRDPVSVGAIGEAGLLEVVPRLRGLLLADTTNRIGTGAVILDMRQESDWGVLWEVANQVSQLCCDCFVSDLECREVYRLHHHGKVVVAIPERSSRQELVDDLGNWSHLIEDCSWYVSDWDDEDDQA